MDKIVAVSYTPLTKALSNGGFIMKMADFGVAGALRQLFPHFVTCGRIALRVQEAIRSGRAAGIAQKGGNAFTAALTDADIMIESYLGMVLLSTYEDVAFFGEEYATDRISGYFPKTAAYTVTLDPVDGTRYFMDGTTLFGIIMTVLHEGRMVASVVYMPTDERFFIAVEGSGAFTMTANEAVSGATWSRYRLEDKSRVMLLSDDDTSRKDAMTAGGFTVINTGTDYHGQPDWRYGSLRMLTNDVCGMARNHAQVIDAMAVGYIVAMAGGAWNDPAYDPATMHAPRLICASSPDAYKKIAEALGDL